MYRWPTTIGSFICRIKNYKYVIRVHGSLDPYLFKKSVKGKIFYSCLNSKEEAVAVEQALKKSKSFIRTMLGKSLNLKKIPNIAFFKDQF